MLASEGDKVGDSRLVAPLDICSHELPTLGEADGVDGGGFGEDGVGGEVFTDFFYLQRQIT